jgi:hypothetical protein
MGREALQRFEPTRMVISGDELAEMPAQVIAGVVVVSFDGCFFDRPVHSFDLAVRPGMACLGESAVEIGLGVRVFKSLRRAAGPRF